ncbi:MAG: hypothetical protein ACLP7Q_18240 [Isosphaeraceae bacterium]
MKLLLTGFFLARTKRHATPQWLEGKIPKGLPSVAEARRLSLINREPAGERALGISAGRLAPHSSEIAGQIKASKARAQNLGTEERLGSSGHGAFFTRRPAKKSKALP